MKYFQIVLVLVMMAITTPFFYVQATKEITRSQNNKGLIEASSKTQSSISSIFSSVIVESSSQISSSSVQLSSSVSSEIVSFSSLESSSLVSQSSSVQSSSKEEDSRKDELTKKILKSIEEKRAEEIRKDELTKKILKQEEDARLAKQKKIAEEKAKEEARIAEEKRIEEEKKLAEEKAKEEARIAEQKKIAEEKAKELAAKKAAEAPKVISTAGAGSFSEAIDIQCANYGCNPSQLKRIMMCESTGNPNAQNGIYTGLFQFHPQTFSSYAARAGISGANIYNGYDQVAVAAYMFANGQAGQWECR
jgi:membrane protein involved in colicin uptake